MRFLPLLALALAAPALPALAATVSCATDALGEACPDLVVNVLDVGAPHLSTETFSPEHCAVAEGLVEPGARTLLRFPLATGNVGRGPLVLGRPADRPEWFTESPCHRHHHFEGFAAYRLWRADAYPAWAAVRAAEPERPASALLAEHPALAAALVEGRKQGFCLLDGAKLALAAGPPRFSCGHQGISPLWEDRYDAWLDGQWVDVTGLPPAYYVLETETNPERVIAESDYGNNAQAQLVWVG